MSTNSSLLNQQIQNGNDTQIKPQTEKHIRFKNRFNEMSREKSNILETIAQTCITSDKQSDEVSNFQSEKRNVKQNEELDPKVSDFDVDQSKAILKSNIMNFFGNFLNENNEGFCFNLKFIRFLKIVAIKLLRINLDKETQDLLLKIVKKFELYLKKNESESYLFKLMYAYSEKVKTVQA